MKVKSLDANKTQIEYSDRFILYSYETPVAVFMKHGTKYRTNKKWSTTTTKHINAWLRGHNVVRVVAQECIEYLADPNKVPRIWE